MITSGSKKNSYSKKYKTTNIKTQKNKFKFSSFKKEIAIKFLEMLLMIKLYHWKTFSYATHKATDELYLKLNTNIDSFIEILLGKDGSRIDLTKQNKIKLIDLTSQESLQREIENFKTYLVNLNNHKELQQMLNSDLFNMRDTILGDLNQFLYLLTFK